MGTLYSLDLSTWPLIALDWLTIANERTDGLLDIIMAIGVIIPVALAAWGYMSGGSGSEEES